MPQGRPARRRIINTTDAVRRALEGVRVRVDQEDDETLQAVRRVLEESVAGRALRQEFRQQYGERAEEVARVWQQAVLVGWNAHKYGTDSGAYFPF